MSAPAPHTLQLGEITVHLARREVVHPTHRAKLTALEAKLLGHLASRAGELVTQAELLVDVSPAGIPHVRICGGPGRATSPVYPTLSCPRHGH